MTTIQLQTQVSLEDLLNSLQQLNVKELEQVAHHTAVLKARQVVPSLSKEETELLLKMNQGVVPEEVRQRCGVLNAKARQGTITDQEHKELMNLVDQIELLNAERIGYLIRLAELRQMSLEEVMQALEIRPLSYE
jgi:hypothetical protein